MTVELKIVNMLKEQISVTSILLREDIGEDDAAANDDPNHGRALNKREDMFVTHADENMIDESWKHNFVVENHEKLEINETHIKKSGGSLGKKLWNYAIQKAGLNKRGLADDRILVSKLLFFHSNKYVYLICKILGSMIYVMNRMIFFILLIVNNSQDSLVSIMAIIGGFFIWIKHYNSIQNQLSGINLLAIITIFLKQF